MLTLLRHMDLQRYMPRSYVIAATDKMGAAKASSFEAAAPQTAISPEQVGHVQAITRIPVSSGPPGLLSLPSQESRSELGFDWDIESAFDRNGPCASKPFHPNHRTRRVTTAVSAQCTHSRHMNAHFCHGRQGRLGHSTFQVASHAHRIVQDGGGSTAAVVDVVPRSREVGQSWLTSNFTTLHALAPAAAILLRRRPRLLLVNGPGTCIPVCAAAFVFRREVARQ